LFICYGVKVFVGLLWKQGKESVDSSIFNTKFWVLWFFQFWIWSLILLRV
jgi:hypothetical protein